MQHGNHGAPGERDVMGHGGGVKGVLLMALCCLPMVVIALAVVVGLLR